MDWNKRTPAEKEKWLAQQLEDIRRSRALLDRFERATASNQAPKQQVVVLVTLERGIEIDEADALVAKVPAVPEDVQVVSVVEAVVSHCSLIAPVLTTVLL